MSIQPIISIREVVKSYQMGDNTVYALKGVHLDIMAGDFVAIMGPSGSGKSTLMHLLGLLDVPESGSYTLGGREVSKLTQDELAIIRRQEVGFIFQQFHLLPRMSASENVSLPLLYSQKKLNFEKSNSLLKLVGLETRSEHKPNELSGGQQQRVAIARSLVNQPKIIFADEPTGNLDSKSEKEILAILKDLNSQGITIIMVTHEEEIGQQAKRVIRMRDGVIQSDQRQNDTPQIPSPKILDVQKDHFSWGDVGEHFVQGFRTLAANKVRSFLSMLGILIGVGAVVAMLAIGRGAQDAIEKQLSSLGSNLLVLRNGVMKIGGVSQDRGTLTRLTNDDAMEIQQELSTIKAVSPAVTCRSQATYQNKNWSTYIVASGSAYGRMHNLEPEVGRFFDEEEVSHRARVAVLGATLVHELFNDRNPVGEMIKIDKIIFQVIGVLPPRGANAFRDQDDVIVIPYTTGMKRLMGRDFLDYIDIEVNSPDNLTVTQDMVYKMMMKRHHIAPSQNQAFEIRNMADIQQAMAQSNQTMSTLLAVIALISLIVGGIGIMNIMLVSVTERTKEIGLRKAIGAMGSDILMQFLAESVVISTVGGLLGIILGWVSTELISIFSGWTTSISTLSVVISFGFSATVGLIFGIYPAKRASQLNPIEALRHE